MATKTLSNSPHKIKVTYTASNGKVTITELSAYSTNGYRSWDASAKSVKIAVSGTTKTVSLGHYVDFGKSSYTTWSATNTSWTGLTSSTPSIKITLPSMGNTISGKTFSGNLTMSWSTYTVSYNANGGSGAPGNQTKTYGKTLTLSSTKPTRTGYTFQGWGTTASDTSVNYAAGASYTANAAITLYAIWKAKTYTVSYDANGGSGAPGNQTKTYGVALTLSSTKPTRTNYDFVKWNTKADGSGTSYNSGASYTSNAAVTLYAVWKLSGHNITFNANGGTGAPATIFKNVNATITIPTKVPVRSGYDFLGWATSAGGTAVYQPGDSYSTNATLNLYAVWNISDPSGLQLLLKNNSRLVIYCEINPPVYGAGVSLDYYVYTTNQGKITYHGNNLLTVVLEEGAAYQGNVIITIYAVDTAGQQSNIDELIVTPRNCWKSFYGHQELDDKIFYGDTPAALAARKERIFYTNADYQQTTYAEMSQKTYQQLRIKGLN